MNWGLVDVQCFRCTTQCFTTFKDYTPFIVVIKYRLCSLSYMIYPHSLFIHSSLCLPFPAPVWSLPLPPALLPTSLFLCPWVCFCLAMVHQLSSVGSVMSDSVALGLQHARPPCPSPAPRACSNSCPLSWWCHPTISSCVAPFSSRLQSFPASGSFPVSQFFTSGGQNIGVSASTSVRPTNTQDWFPLEWTGWISLQSKGLSRVFSNTTVQKHQFFSAQLSL